MVTQLLDVKNWHNYIHTIKRVQYASNTHCIRSVQPPHPVNFFFFLINPVRIIIFSKNSFRLIRNKQKLTVIEEKAELPAKKYLKTKKSHRRWGKPPAVRPWPGAAPGDCSSQTPGGEEPLLLYSALKTRNNVIIVGEPHIWNVRVLDSSF